MQSHCYLLPPTTEPLQYLQNFEIKKRDKRGQMCVVRCRDKTEFAETGQAAVKLMAINTNCNNSNHWQFISLRIAHADVCAPLHSCRATSLPFAREAYPSKLPIGQAQLAVG